MTAAGAAGILSNLPPVAFMPDFGARAGTRDRHDGRQRGEAPLHNLAIAATPIGLPPPVATPPPGARGGLRNARKLRQCAGSMVGRGMADDGQADETNRGVIFPGI